MSRVVHHQDEVASIWPLVAAQPGIWIADQTVSSHNAYTVAHCVEIPAEIVQEDFVWAIRKALSEADLLHAQFGHDEEGVAYQRIPRVISPAQVMGPTCLDFSVSPDAEAQARAWMQNDLDQDLRLSAQKPLYRHAVIRLSHHPARWLWYQRYHHVAVDGFSVNEIARRVAHLYTARQRGEQPAPTPFISFTHVVDEYQRYRHSTAYTKDAQFWQAQSRELGPPVTLSSHPLSEHTATTAIIKHTTTLSTHLFKTDDATQPAMSRVMAVLALWIGRLSGHAHFTLGHIFMRRLGSQALNACGPVINVLPMNVRLLAEATLNDTALAMETTLKQMRRHQRFDAEQIQRDLGRVNDATPLVGIVLNIKFFDRALAIAGAAATTQELMTGPVRDLEIMPSLEANGALTLTLQAHGERYTHAELQTLVAGLQALIGCIERDPQAPIAQFSALTPEQQLRLKTINATAHALPERTLCALLTAQAKATPKAPALQDVSTALTYREMRVQVEALARHLRAHGAARHHLVAVALPRSVALSVTLMAILETGAAYLPLDTGYPDQRLRWMVEDAQPVMIVTTSELQDRFQGWAPLVRVEEAPAIESIDEAPLEGKPFIDDPAYVLYTSGSTGKPKGVVISHRAIVNRLLWMQDRYALTARDTVLQKTPCSFDVSVWEFFWPLMTGAQLVMAPPEAHRDPEQLVSLIDTYRVTTLHFVPSMLSAFLEALSSSQRRACGVLRHVFCSGEALSTSLARQWARDIGCALHNLYGPTEAAVDVSYYPAFGDALAGLTGTGVPIGYPVWNTQLYILDPHLQPVPSGVAGELYIGGTQLAEGYLHRPELTADRFMTHPNLPDERCYRTGDIARWNDNGAIEYLGRNDDQLKLRGQRIELGEIESALCELPEIAQAVVVARAVESTETTADTRQLVGYVMCDPGVAGDLDIGMLRQRLSAQLPPHLVPVHILRVEAWPLSANGKLDRKALPAPRAVTAQGRLPSEGLEADIAHAFEAVLNHTPVYADDDFFALGGHSLLAMQLVARLRQVMARSISVGQLMETSTVAELAATLRLPEQGATPLQAGFEAILPLRQRGSRTVFCVHPASGFAWQFSVLLRYLDNDWDIIGLQSPSETGPMASASSLGEVCEQQLAQIKALQPQGPYFLLGYSLGGTLAHGIAACLRAQGEHVAFLGLLDTYPPESREWGGTPDEEVIAEIARERTQFMDSARQGMDAQAQAQQHAMFTAIEHNYAHAIRLLGSARSPHFKGTATLFVAEHTRPQDEDIKALWQPYVGALALHNLPCGHVDMMSAAVFERLGPLLNGALNRHHYSN